MIKKLRLRWAMARRGLSYSDALLERIYKVYLGHSKILHFRDGYPVYSLSTPAMFSKPSANFFARILYRSIQNKNIPNLMSFAVNDICNARCENCSFFNGVEEKNRKVLTLEQCKKLIRDAQELGVSVINFVGGEPLLRPDLHEIIASVDKDLSTTIMFTNGTGLEEKAQMLKDAGLDSVYISLDTSSPGEHDIIRHRMGLFKEAVVGIKRARSVGLSTGISCTLTPETFARGEMKKIVELGKSIGVHEVVFFDALPTGRLKDRQDLVDNPEWTEKLINETKQYNLLPDYPGVISHAYTTSFRSVGCACGTSYFYISPYGDLMSCDFNHAKFGNILEAPLWKLWDQMTNLPDFKQAKWGGCKVKDSAFRARETVVTGK